MTVFIPIKGQVYAKTLWEVTEAIYTVDKIVRVVILVCDHEGDTIPYLKDVRGEQVYLDMPKWSRAHAFNSMYWLSDDDVLVFNDADVAPCNSDWFDRIRRRMDSGAEYAINYNALQGVQSGGFLGGSTTITRGFLRRTGGMDARMHTWGFEDTDFTNKVRSLTGWPTNESLRIEALMRHVGHPRDAFRLAMANEAAIWKENQGHCLENMRLLASSPEDYCKNNRFIDDTRRLLKIPDRGGAH